MQPNEFYLAQYNTKVQELTAKNELWRLRVSEQEFLQKIEELRIYEAKEKESKCLNDYHIESNVKGSVAVMLMDKMTIEEMKTQSKRMQEYADIGFQKEAPKIKILAEKITAPITNRDTIYIYRWLFRNQIQLTDLKPDVLKEFQQTRNYQTLINRKKINTS